MSDDTYLNDIISGSTETLSENIFITRYLPLIFQQDPAYFNLTWLNEVSKSPHARVYITNPIGEVLFSVPPLTANPLQGVDNIINALNYIQLESSMHAKRGSMLLEQNLPALVNIDENRQTYVQEWYAIFDRYGLTDRYVKPEENKTSEQATFTDELDDW